MTHFKPFAALSAVVCLGMPPTPGHTAEDAAALRAEIDTLKSQYDARIAALEARLVQLEAASSGVAMSTDAPPASGAAPAPAPGSAAALRSTAAAFNPALSLIIGGSYTSTSQPVDDWRIAGFLPNGGEVGPGPRSFNLGESELTLSANVDPYFSAMMIASVSGEDEIGIEEAYFRTIALPSGFTAKGGRFFSGFGYLNEVHAHAWDFVDQPLVYQAFFGGQRPQDGLQVKWLAPSDLFVEFGGEAGKGTAFPGTRRTRNGLNGATLFAHVGGDIGNSSWRAGGSWLEMHAEERLFDDVDSLAAPVLDAFSGTSRTWMLDGVFKWAPNGNIASQQLKVQAEYMHRTETGRLGFDLDNLNLNGAYRGLQSGWYVQSVYQFRPRWRMGLRYDALESGTPRIGLVDSGVLLAADFTSLLSARPTRITLMLDWSPSEFSRLRAQYAWDDARDSGARDRQFRLQYIHGIGAHGAHKY
jgi:hypothetical protein